uniref:Uncharacterized protein n=1 Tax=Cryptomonas curvata TaxID=233186 RepID=A0A7S0N4J6_9CRYP|mmetsp:Transcript_6799/g.14755  ORF Transcript_6799/g.14755 Transcript_6799/m.14755 type:complete len:278 (+) Transcript_6799:78-911(+)
MIGEGEEIAEQFLRFPGMLNSSEMRDYEDLYHQDFQAILPSPKAGGGLYTISRDEWLFLQKALVKGFPDWNYNGRVWVPVSEPEGWEEIVHEKTGEKLQNVHILTRITGTHLGDGPTTLTLEGIDYKATGRRAAFPVEWWTLTVNHRLHRQLVRLQFIKVLDASACSTGGYSLVPGALFAIGRPLPPAPQALRHPFPCFPPGDAADLDDPSWWQVRLQIFQQITAKSDEERTEMKRLIDRQTAELRQHLDYLVAIENYLLQDRLDPREPPPDPAQPP